MTFRRPHNMIALLVVLIISLITNPAFAMPGQPAMLGHNVMSGQQSMLGSHAEANHHTASASDTSPMTHHQAHSNMLHCDDCSNSAMMDSTHCGNDGENSHCKSCNSSHCQFSALPVFYLAQSNLSNKAVAFRLLVSPPISRQETSLRPPIH